MATKDEALDQILAIARSHGLTSDDIKAGFGQIAEESEKRSTALLGRILGSLGGTFLFAGLAVFIVLNWGMMNGAARIIITLGAGLSAFALALVASNEEHFQKVQIPLYLIAVVLQPTGILVAIDNFSSGGNWLYAALITAGIMVLQQGTVFWQKRLTALLFTTMLFALWFFGVTLHLLQVELDIIALVLGGSTVMFCIGLERTAHRVIIPFWYLAGSVYFFGGLFALLVNTFIELLFVVVACGGVFLSMHVRSPMLLFVSTATILGYVSHFTNKYFLDSLGWPLVLVLLGFVLIGLSALAIRINRRYIVSR